MKTISLLAISVIVFAFLAGCGGNSNTPEGVVRKQIDAMRKWDTKTAFSYVSFANEAAKEEALKNIENVSNEAKNISIAIANNTKIIKTEINGDSAIVHTEIPIVGTSGVQLDQKEEIKIELLKKDGAWLIVRRYR